MNEGLKPRRGEIILVYAFIMPSLRDLKRCGLAYNSFIPSGLGVDAVMLSLES